MKKTRNKNYIKCNSCYIKLTKLTCRWMNAYLVKNKERKLLLWMLGLWLSFCLLYSQPFFVSPSVSSGKESQDFKLWALKFLATGE